jgi:hypothetical protein
MDLDFIIQSSDDLRYEHGIHVSGPHGGARRAIVVEPNTSGVDGFDLVPGDGVIVSIYNLDGPNSFWKDNLQMAHKPLRIVGRKESRIELRGFLVQARSTFGWVDFEGADYGLTIELDGDQVEQCTLHMFDRHVDIVYAK